MAYKTNIWISNSGKLPVYPTSIKAINSFPHLDTVSHTYFYFLYCLKLIIITRLIIVVKLDQALKLRVCISFPSHPPAIWGIVAIINLESLNSLLQAIYLEMGGDKIYDKEFWLQCQVPCACVISKTTMVTNFCRNKLWWAEKWPLKMPASWSLKPMTILPYTA